MHAARKLGRAELGRGPALVLVAPWSGLGCWAGTSARPQRAWPKPNPKVNPNPNPKVLVAPQCAEGPTSGVIRKKWPKVNLSAIVVSQKTV